VIAVAVTARLVGLTPHCLASGGGWPSLNTWGKSLLSLLAKSLALPEMPLMSKAVLASVGVDADGAWDPKHMLDEDAYYGMIELMAEQMDITPLPLIVGDAMRPDEYGALGLAWKAAPNLLGSFSRVARYCPPMDQFHADTSLQETERWHAVHRTQGRRSPSRYAHLDRG
jgi:hypothetical protein